MDADLIFHISTLAGVIFLIVRDCVENKKWK